MPDLKSGDVITFWRKHRYRAGYYVRTTTKGKRKGELVVRLGNREVSVKPSDVQSVHPRRKDSP